MSWVSENRFLTGFGAVMLVSVGTLGYLTYSAMDKSDAATAAFDTSSAQLKKLREAKPSLTDAHLKELLAQKQEMTEKIETFQQEFKKRVLPMPGDAVTPAQFQDKLKDAVAQIAGRAVAARVERPKDFYLGFGDYQSKPPSDKAAPALARQLKAIELVMNVLIKTGGLELEELHRDPLPEEGAGTSGKKRNSGSRSDQGQIERNGLEIKFSSSDDALRKVLTELANHKEQLFIIRKVSVQNKVQDSPIRAGGAPPPPAPAPAPEAPGAPEPAPGTPPAPAPAKPAAAANEGPLAYVFGTEKITSVIELEVLNIEAPKAGSEKPEKGSKKKDK